MAHEERGEQGRSSHDGPGDRLIAIEEVRSNHPRKSPSRAFRHGNQCHEREGSSSQSAEEGEGPTAAETLDDEEGLAQVPWRKSRFIGSGRQGQHPGARQTPSFIRAISWTSSATCRVPRAAARALAWRSSEVAYFTSKRRPSSWWCCSSGWIFSR